MPASHDDDIELAVLTVAGDLNAYAELVRRHQPAVLALLVQLTHHRPLADDIAQDSFVRGFTKLHQYTGAGSFRSWICGVAYREWLMHRRRNQHDHKLSAFNEDFHSPVIADTTMPMINQIDLQNALDCLQPEERELLILSFVAECSHADIASMTKLPLGTVKSQIRRAKENLKNLLNGPHND